MQALVLAGGEGTRLRPLTYTTPKPVMPLAGRPFLSFMLDWLNGHGVDEVILSCGFMSEGVRQVLGDIYNGMRLRYVIEEEPLGTAGPVRLAFDQGVLEERLLILNGDVLTDMDLTAELATHERTGARVTLALHPVEDTSSYGVVPIAEDGQVEAFLEKTDAPPTNLVNAGAYVLEREVVDDADPRRDAPSRSSARCSRSWSAPASMARSTPGYWVDIGTPERYLEATWDLLAGRVASELPRARRDRFARLRELPAVGRPHRPPERARPPLLGRHRRARRALGAARARPRGRGRGDHRGGAGRAGARRRARTRRAGGHGGRRRRDRGGCSDRRRSEDRPGRDRRGRGARVMTLDRARIEAADPQGMLGDVLAMPLQLGDALWRAQSADIRPVDSPAGLVVCGMGGSAIGGDLALAALGDRATRPIYVVRGYAIESWTPPETLVLCSSYSGETEEVLACFEAAGAAGARRVVLTTGGRLAEAARAEGVPVIGVPSGMQPRAAVLYGLVGALECAMVCGAAPSLHSEIDTATALLERLVEEWGPDCPDDALPKRLAHELRGTLPVIHGSGPTVAIARRWHTQLNENAKAPAFWSELPEANHNEICAWERGTGLRAAVGGLPRGSRPAPAHRPPHRPHLRGGRALRGARDPRQGAGREPARARALARAARRSGERVPRRARGGRSNARRRDRAPQVRSRLTRMPFPAQPAEPAASGSGTNLDTIVVRFAPSRWMGSRSTKPLRRPAGRLACCAT